MVLGSLGRMNVLITATNRASSEINKVQGDMRGLASKARSTGKTMMAIGAAGAAGIGLAVRESAKLEQKFGEVQTLVSNNRDVMEEFGTTVEDLSEEFAVQGGQTKILNSLYQTLSGGITETERAQAVLRQATKLSTAGLASQEQTTKALIKVMNSYGADAEEASEISNQFFKTMQLGQTTVEELGGAFPRVVGQAASMGVEFEEVGGTMSVLVNTMEDARKAGTAMSAIFRAFIKPTDAMTKQVQELGFESAEAMLKQEGLVESVRMLSEASGGSTQKLGEMFNRTRALRGVTQLQAQGFDKLAANTEKVADASGTLNEEISNVNQTFSAQMTKTMNSVRNLAADLGKEFAQVLRPALEKVQGVVDGISNAFNSLSSDQRSLVAAVTVGATAALTLGGALLFLAGVAIPPLLTGLSAVATVAGAVTLPMLAVAAAVGLIGAAVATNFMGIRDTIVQVSKQIWSALKPVVNGLLQIFKQYASFTLDMWGRQLQAVGKFVQFFSKAYDTVLKPIIKNLGASFIATFHTIKGAIEFGISLFQTFKDAASELMQDVADFVASGMESVADTIISGLQDVLDAVAEAASTVPGISFSAPQIGDMIPDLTSVVGDAFSSAEGESKDFMAEIRDKMVGMVGGQEAQNQLQAFENMVDQGTGTIRGLGQAVEQAGTGLRSMSDDVQGMNLNVGQIEKAIGGGQEKGQAKPDKKEQNFQEGAIQINAQNGDPKQMSRKLQKELSKAGIR